MSDSDDVDLEPSLEELNLEPPVLVKSEDQTGVEWESQVYDFENYSSLNEEGFLSLEVLDMKEFTVNHNKDSGIASIKRKDADNSKHDASTKSKIHPKLAAGELFCQVCKLKIPSEACLKEHLEGKKHKKALAKAEWDGVYVDLEILRGDAIKSNDASSLKCVICGITAGNQKVMAIHVKGKKHRNKVLEQEAIERKRLLANSETHDFGVVKNTQDDQPDIELSSFHCKVCNKIMSSEKTLQQHLQSSKHKKMLKKVDKEAKTQLPLSTSTENSISSSSTSTSSDGKKTSSKLKQKEEMRSQARQDEIDAVKASSAFDNDHLKGAWSSFGLQSELSDLLVERGFEAPTQVQLLSIPAAIQDGRDLCVTAHTGSGKTLAFGLPILHNLLNQTLHKTTPEYNDRKLHSLIMAPTRELAMQVCIHLQAFSKPLNVTVIPVVGGMAVQKQTRQLNTQKPEVVVGTPGRLCEMVNTRDNYLSDLGSLNFLVIDEADRMVTPGAYPELKELFERIKSQESSRNKDSSSKKVRKRQTFLFSATLMMTPALNLKTKRKEKKKKKGKKMETRKPPLEALIESIGLRGKPAIINSDELNVNSFSNDASSTTSAMNNNGKSTSSSGNGVTLPDGLQLCSYDALDDKEKDQFLYYFSVQYPGRTLVFVNAIKTLRRVLAYLGELNVNVVGIHAQMQQKQRLKNLDRFKSSDNYMLIATDVAARGLDIDAVNHVLHYHIPHTLDSFVHRSGRTARGNTSGLSVAMLHPEEQRLWQTIESNLNTSQQNAITRFPVDNILMRKVQPRASLAIRIAKLTREENKVSQETSWVERQAKECDMILDEQILKEINGSHHGVDVNAKKHSELQRLRQKLHKLNRVALISNVGNGAFVTVPAGGAVKRKRDALSDLQSKSKVRKFMKI